MSGLWPLPDVPQISNTENSTHNVFCPQVKVEKSRRQAVLRVSEMLFQLQRQLLTFANYLKALSHNYLWRMRLDSGTPRKPKQNTTNTDRCLGYFSLTLFRIHERGELNGLTVSISGTNKDMCLHQHAQASSGNHRASRPVGAGGRVAAARSWSFFSKNADVEDTNYKEVKFGLVLKYNPVYNQGCRE